MQRILDFCKICILMFVAFAASCTQTNPSVQSAAPEGEAAPAAPAPPAAAGEADDQAPSGLKAYALLMRSINARNHGQEAEADELLQQALTVCDYPLSQYNLIYEARILGAIADREHLQLECFARILVAFDKSNGAEHIEFAYFLRQLARHAIEDGRRPEAIRHYEQALRIHEKQMGSDHAETVELRQEIEKLKQAP